MLEVYQSGFRVNHSTETALSMILKLAQSVLVLLDRSAAFDMTISLFFSAFQCLGLGGKVLFYNNLTGRSFSVSFGKFKSDEVDIEVDT